MKKYTTIVADPPWPYHSPTAVVGNGGRGSQNGEVKRMIQTNVLHHYPVMSIENIKSLPINELTEKNAHLYLWTTNSFLVEAHEVAKSWGFQPKTLITWVKVKKTDRCKPSMKTGYWYRSATEHILFCVKGKLRLLSDPHPTVFMATRLKHSCKPEYSYNMIKKQSPGPYLELFARQRRDDFDCWGNEIKNDIEFENACSLT